MMWLIVVVAFIWLVVFPLFQLGMFTDGMLYASIARNFYLGQGSWWNIYSHQPTGVFFYEQPPLVFWLQSFFFQLIGDSIYAERVYSFVLILCSGFLIIKFWKELNHETKTAWLPLLLWLSIYAVRFSVINNVIENTLQFFDLCSVYFLFKVLTNKSWLLNSILALLFLFLASLSKGIQGLFPIAVPFCYWIAFRNSSIRKSVTLTFFLIAGIAVIYFSLFQSPEISESYKAYFDSRFPGFPNTPHSNTSNRLYLFLQLLIELLPPVFICLFILFFVRKKQSLKIEPTSEQRRFLIFFLLVGLSASLPLMISFEQRFFYLTTSMPFFILGLSVVTEKYFQQLSIFFQNKIQFIKGLSVTLSILILSGIITTYLFAGKITRDKKLLSDVFIIGNKFKNETVLDVSKNGWDNWTAHTYFRRYFNIELIKGTSGHHYFLLPKKEEAIDLPNYNKLEMKTEYYEVYQLK